MCIANSDTSNVEITPKAGRWRRVLLTSLGAVLTMVALVLVDCLTGLAYHTSTDVSVVVTLPLTGTVDEALIVFPGYAADGTVVSKAFAPYLDDDQAMIVLRYAQRGVDDQAIYRLIIDQLNALAPRRVRILGGSMGGIVADRFLTHYSDSPEHSRFGNVVLVLDTVPSSPDKIRRPQWMFVLSSWYRGGPISSAIWALISQWGSRPLPEPGADQATIDEGNHNNAWVGVPALATQASYLASFSPGEIPGIHHVILRATYLKASSAQDDPLVRVNESIIDWRTRLPHLVVATIAKRQGSWHLPWTYRPRETLDAVNAA